MSRKIKDIKRFNKVLNTLIKYEFGFLLNYGKSKTRSDIAEPVAIRNILEDLGGTYVKLGQLLSLRPDLVPPKYADEFSKLQDKVRAFPTDIAKKIIENSTKKKIKNIFSSFPKKPIAAASISQVYKAKLINKKDVAVKVRRPKIIEILEVDMDILEFIAKGIDKYTKKEIIDTQAIVNEFREYTKEETNFLIEMQRLVKFKEFSKNTELLIPSVYKEFCNSELLVLEYIEGTKLNEVIKKEKNLIKRKEVAELIVNSFFKQILSDGIFHADPHPGNILVLDHEKYEDKKICLLDFGIVGVLNKDARQSLIKLFLSLLNKDLEGITTAMIALHLVNDDNSELKKDIREMLGPYYGVGLSKVDVPKLFLQFIKVAKKHEITIPKDYVLLGKAFVTIESVCESLNPDFNFVESSKPFVTKLMLERFSPKRVINKGRQEVSKIDVLLREIPNLVSTHFESEKEHNKFLENISYRIDDLEREIDVVSERFFLIVAAAILLVGAFLLRTYPPLISGVSIFSIISLLLSFSFFITLLRTKKH